MSKPLAFVLQLVALWLIVAGAMSEPVGYAQITIGVLIAIAAGAGIRKRFKSG